MATKQSSLHQVLFRLAARAPRLDLESLMNRLCTGVANYYGAVACSIHTNRSGWAAAAAEPIRAISKMSPLDKARRETMEARLVTQAVETRELTSALDLEDRDSTQSFLNRTLGVIDIFAFPLQVEGTVRAVLVLYLSLNSDPLQDGDIHGLLHSGELLTLAGGED